MKLREALWFFAVPAGISILAAALYQAAKTPEQNRSFQPVLPEGVLMEMSGASRITSTQDGKVEWTMLSQGLKYYQSTELVAVDEPRAWVPMRDGGTVEVSGRSGEYVKGSEDITIRDGVEVELNKDARREWVVYGDTASYRKREDAFYIGRLAAVMSPASGDTVRITALNGRYDAAARTMAADHEVNCRWQNGMTLLTDWIEYHVDTNQAETDRPVTISGQGFKLQGEGMTADLAGKRVRIERKVGLRLEKGMKGLK